MAASASSSSSSSSSSSTTTKTIPARKRGWLSNISSISSRIYFFLIFLQIPLFRIPCRSGMCSTPIHVTSSQLIASDIFPVPVVKAILFPGAITNGLAKNWTVPSWDNLLNTYNLTSIKESSALPDLQRLEVLAGSYFCVAGALVGLLKPGRMSMFGTLLVIWGLVKEGIIGKPANTDLTKAVYVYPTVSCVFERGTLCNFWVAPKFCKGLDKVELDEVCSFHGLVFAAPAPFPPFIVAADVAYAFFHYGDNIGSSCGFSFVIKENNLEPELKWIIAWKNGPCNDNKVYTNILPLSDDVDWDQIKCNLKSENCGPKSCCDLSGIKAEAFIEPGVKTTMKAKLIKQ